jgi:methyl acetate hydrolase
MRRAGSGAWAGLCNTQFWVDRSAGVCGSIYSNFLPFVTPEAVTMYNDFERALYASLRPVTGLRPARTPARGRLG